ncbi:hypothetical protein KQX54_000680, partial [Cotesia glomerata]
KNSRLASLKSVNSTNSSTSSFKSAKSSTSSPALVSKTNQNPSTFSSTSPAFLLSPASDSVFDSPTSSSLTMAELTNQVIQNSGATNSESQNELPDGWFNKSTDEKLTLLMTTISTHITKKVNEMSSKFDNLNKRLDELHKLKSNFEKLKDETITNSQALSEKIMALTSQTPMTSSTVVQQTSELIISGVPEPVATELSPSDIADKVFEVLNVNNLKQDILRHDVVLQLEFKLGSESNELSKSQLPRYFRCHHVLKASFLGDTVLHLFKDFEVDGSMFCATLLELSVNRSFSPRVKFLETY